MRLHCASAGVPLVRGNLPAASLQVLNETELLGGCDPMDMVASPNVTDMSGAVAVLCSGADEGSFTINVLEYASTAVQDGAVSDGEEVIVPTESLVTLVEEASLPAFAGQVHVMRWVSLLGVPALLTVASPGGELASAGGLGLTLHRSTLDGATGQIILVRLLSHNTRL